MQEIQEGKGAMAVDSVQDVGQRTPARQLTREDLEAVSDGYPLRGCCTQGCCS